MPFAEKIKISVKKKAAFRCCRCQSLGIDIHHIIPEKDKGTNNIDNAAPLCQNCHSQFGGNPDKRKEITQMRDWWYEKCEDMYEKHNYGAISSQLSQIDEKIESIQKDKLGIPELKSILKDVSNRFIDDITPETATVAASGIINAASATSMVSSSNHITSAKYSASSSSQKASATQLGEKVYANFQCRNCNTRVGLMIGSSTCPHCGANIS